MCYIYCSLVELDGFSMHYCDLRKYMDMSLRLWTTLVQQCLLCSVFVPFPFLLHSMFSFTGLARALFIAR